MRDIEKSTSVRAPGDQVVDLMDENDDEYSNEDEDEGDYGQPCRFGRPCGVLLTDITEEGINRHLARYHLQDLQDSVIN